MNRHYSVAQYKNIIKKLRKPIPDISLSTDIIVGFHGETKKQFENTAKLFREIKFDMAYINKYSPRAGTAAEKLKDNVSIAEKKRREKVLTEILKQIALEKSTGDWILQLDADEVVTSKLAKEISSIVNGLHTPVNNKLFRRHQNLIEARDGKIGKPTGEIVGYFVARRNIFLGKPLIHAGVYPDGGIRLVKKGKAHFPQKSVHEQIQLDGEVAWLSSDLLHYDSPTLKRYLARLNRYTDLKAFELQGSKVKKSFWNFLAYTICWPLFTFCKLYFRHLGFLDGARGFLWSFFSAMHFPIAYFKYLTL